MARCRRRPVQPAPDVFADILPVTAAARRAGYSAGHVRLLADTGRIQAQQFGRIWLIYYPSLASYIYSNSHRLAQK